VSEQFAPADVDLHGLVDDALPLELGTRVGPAEHSTHEFCIEHHHRDEPAPAAPTYAVEALDFEKGATAGAKNFGTGRVLSMGGQDLVSDVLGDQEIGQAFTDPISHVRRGIFPAKCLI
jgi:hypothetical protein